MRKTRKGSDRIRRKAWLFLGMVLVAGMSAGSVGAAEADLGAFLSEPRFDVRPIFSDERFPNIVTAIDGTLVAVWGQNQVRVRRSLDGGENWGEEIPLGPGIHGGGAVVDETTGDIFVFVEDGHPPSPLTVYRSSDHGLSWEEAKVEIHPDENGNVPSMHMNEAGITLRRGEHAGRLLRPARSYGDGNDREYWASHYTNAIYSDDGGSSWQTSAPFPARGTGEAALVELSDGRIYYNSRRHLSTDGRDPRRRYVAWSEDGGESWTDLSVSEILPDGPQNLDYGLMAGLVRLPVAGKDILLFSNTDSPGKPEGTDARWSERRSGTVWVSFDGGQSWPLKRLITDGAFAYSSLEAGRIGTPSEGWVYLLFEGTARGAHSGGQIARFNLSWLLGGEETGDGEIPENFADLRAKVRVGAEQSSLLHLPDRLADPRAGALVETDVYWQGMNGYHTFRIPALIEAPDGTLLAFAEGRRNGPSDAGDIDTVVRRSFDGGKSWEPLQVVWADGSNTCGNPTVLLDRVNGRLWLFLTHNLGADTQRRIADGSSESVRTIWSTYSDDNGATWSTPVNRFDEVQRPDTRWDATGPGNGIQLIRGPHAGRLIIPVNGRNIQSDDFGQTWSQSRWLPPGSSEATVIERSDGVLVRNSRATGGLRNQRSRVVNKSTDGGASWSPVEVRKDLPCPICQGSMITHEIAGASKPLVLFSNPSRYKPDDRTTHDQRLRMTVRISESDGEAFEHSRIIFPRDAAYSSLASRSDGSIGLLYENGDDWPYRRITYANFSPEWIRDPGYLQLDFADFAPGQFLPTTADSIIDRTGYGITATPTSPFEVVPGKREGESAVRFTGVGNGIRIQDAGSRGRLNFYSDSSFIIRVVFRTRAHRAGGADESGALVAKDVGPSSPSWWLRIQDGRAVFFLDDGDESVSLWSPVPVANNQWHDLVVVRDAEERRVSMILNGRVVSEVADNTNGDFANESDFVIGAFAKGNRQFSGEIDRVEIARGPLETVLRR